MNDKIYLAIDSGGSKTLWRCVDNCGNIIGEIKTEGMGAINAGILPVYDITRQASLEINKLGVPAGIYVSLGGPNTDEVCSALKSVWSDIDIIVEREANGNAILEAAKFLNCSSVVMCGTGSTAVGEKIGIRAYAGGWGPIYGDGGSCGGLGSDALKIFLKSLDSKEDVGLLSGVFTSLTEGLDIRNFPKRMELKRRALALSRRELAALAPKIYELADMNDKYSLMLYEKAAEEVSLMASAVCDNDENKKVLLCGGFFKNKPNLLAKCYDEFSKVSSAKMEYNENFNPIIAATVAVLNHNKVTVTQEIFENIIKGE